MSPCHCGSGEPFEDCCGPVLSGAAPAATAESLMRARGRDDWDRAATERWAKSSEWLSLEIRSKHEGEARDEQGTVEFVAVFKEKGLLKRHHEISRFAKQGERWYYVEGEMPKPETQRNTQKVGRNDPCPCGSGKKYKKCCGI